MPRIVVATALLSLALTATARAQDIVVTARDPAAAALVAFDAACARLDDAATVRAAAEGDGWAAFDFQYSTELANILYYAGRSMAKFGSKDVSHWTYRKEVGERRLVLAVSEFRRGLRGTNIECRVIDFTLPAPPQADTLARWTTAAPTAAFDGKGALIRRWKPGWKAGQGQTGMLFQTVDAALRGTLPGSGLMLVAMKQAVASADLDPAGLR